MQEYKFTTMPAEEAASGDYVMFNEAVRVAFVGINHAHIDMDIAGLIFRNSAIKYRFVVENFMTYIVLSHVIPRFMIEQVFTYDCKRLCLYGTLDKAKSALSECDDNDARKISIQKNLIEAIEVDIERLRKHTP